MNKAKLIKLCQESDGFKYGGELFRIVSVSNRIVSTLHNREKIGFYLDEVLLDINGFEFYIEEERS